VREYAWRHRVRRRGHLLHDEGRVAESGLVYSRQWLALPAAIGRPPHDKAAWCDFPAEAYFTYIRKRFHGLVQVRQDGSSLLLSVLALPLLRLTSRLPTQPQDARHVGYTISGGLLAIKGASSEGRLLVLLDRLPAGGSRLLVEVSDYPARLLGLGPAGLLYRLTQVQVHRWITFGYLLWCAEQEPVCGRTAACP
jgi:hypothetical protein